MPHACPRCQRANPDAAVFCYYDGAELRPGTAARAYNRLAQEFVFPSGRRCRTFDELAQGCQDDWPAARELLKQGVFGQFFSAGGRMDLARASQEATAQADADLALTMFLGALPVSHGQTPRLDLNPRRLLLGNMLAGESKQIQLTVSNQGQGVLQGTLKVTEGGEWLKVGGAVNGQCPLKTARDQQITLHVVTRGLEAAQTYGAMLRVVTNGGVVEVPVRMDLVAHSFARPPFQGVKTPREMAERMRLHPKQAVPLFETGEVSRWFADNGWKYPVRGTPAKGVAGVQQFFEAMGLSKPPAVRISQPEVRFVCHYPESARGQVTLHTSSKKWVYAEVESDSPWLKVLTPQVGGPQQAAIGFEVDSRQLGGGRAEGQLRILANAGQRLSLRVGAEVRGARSAAAVGGSQGRLMRSVVATALAFLVLRLVLVPIVDFFGRGPAARAAAAKLEMPPDSDSPLSKPGGWLGLPWSRILLGTSSPVLGSLSAAEFRHYSTKHLLRTMVLWTWWIGAVAGALLLLRWGGVADLPWGLIAGSIAGIAGGATAACALVVAEIVPHAFWDMAIGAGNLGLLLIWVVLVLIYWTLLGGAVGLVINLTPLRTALLNPMQNAVAGLCRICGLRGLAGYCAPS